MNLVLAPGILDQVTSHAQGAYPAEGCGLLVGLHSAVDRFIPMKNISPSEAHYEMDPGELISALRDLRNTGEDLLAIYHSHPRGPAQLSQTDIGRAYYPDAAHLIISLAEPESPQAAAFRIIDGAVFPVEVHVIV
jgi:[CysO sulfur-carrier protein]-S-L-cysteine hydrolase